MQFNKTVINTDWEMKSWIKLNYDTLFEKFAENIPILIEQA